MIIIIHIWEIINLTINHFDGISCYEKQYLWKSNNMYILSYFQLLVLLLLCVFSQWWCNILLYSAKWIVSVNMFNWSINTVGNSSYGEYGWNKSFSFMKSTCISEFISEFTQHHHLLAWWSIWTLHLKFWEP